MEKTLIASDNEFDRLVSLIETLRSDHGCPWDREQTPDSVKVYLIEETYEVLEAIESGTSADVCGELGDLLFQVLFLASIFEEKGEFNIWEVAQKITAKMIRRHPHVFGDSQVSSADEVKDRWHEIKMAEAQASDPTTSSFLDSVPKKLPALMRAYRLGERAARVGLDWPDASDAITKANKELGEFTAAVERGDAQRSVGVFGALMFTLTSLARLSGVHPETALSQTISKFINRFKALEQALVQQGRSLDSATPDEMEAMWEQCKT